MQQSIGLGNRTSHTTENFAAMRVYLALLIGVLSVAGAGGAQAPDPTAASAPAPNVRLDRVVDNQKRNDAEMEFFERIERVEIRKTANAEGEPEVKISRVIPAGTGTDHIPVGPDGNPTDPAAYRAALEKLSNALALAVSDSRAQRDAYEKIAKKRKERDELVEATRTAFLFTYVGQEPRGGRMLTKYRMLPNPAYKATSRSTAIFAKVRGYVWVDEEASQLAKVEGEVTEDISVGLFLAKVNKGSHFMQERYEFAPGLWFPSYSQYDFDGRKLFSSFSFHERTFYSKYHRIGPPKEALEAIRQELAASKVPARGE
jgi:hypothetical protein